MPELYKAENNISISLNEKIRSIEDIRRVEDILRKKLVEESRDPIIPSRIEIKDLLVINWKRFEDE